MPKITYRPESHKLAFHRFLFGEESSDGEWRAFCPMCEDPNTSNSPSASFNFDKGVWHCAGACGEGSGITALVKVLKDQKGFDFRSERMKGAHLDQKASKQLKATSAARRSNSAPLPSAGQLTAWSERLLKSPNQLAVLIGERGFTEETITNWQIGWDGSRYTIPVLDENLDLANVRRYSPKAKSSDKMYNLTGHGQARIFAMPVLLKEDVVVLTEGETDCIILNQIGIPAVTHTAGASTFRPAWGELFAGKTVYICYDNDEAGSKGATKAANILRRHAKVVYNIEIPIPVKGADITDYIVKEGHSADDFRELMRESEAEVEVVRIEDRPAPPLEGRRMTLEASMSQEAFDETADLMVTIAGKQNPPYIVPQSVHVTCDMSAGPMCAACPIALLAGDTSVTFQPDDTRLFRFLKQNENVQKAVLKNLTGAKCNSHVNYEVVKTYNMEHLIVGNAIDDRDPGVDQAPLTREMYSVGTHKTPVNTTVKVIGKNVADPRDNRLSFMAWHNEQVRTSLDSFEMTDEMRDELLSFRNNPEQTPLQKCEEIADHMEVHVSNIYGRRNMHIAYDLVWHSPLAFKIGGRMMDKGWLEMMVVGDTRTGKSETAIRLAEYYGAGVVKSCEGATFAGLVGGAQKMGGKDGPFTITWGVIPLNDRRLVVLDEVSGLKDKDVIENMSSIRSSGRAEMTKITAEETSARTRLIWITNPGDGSMIADHPDAGMAALRTVVKANEDIARFDFVMAATANEVASEVINAVRRKPGKPFYTKEMCQSLVLWAWSRTPDQIRFTDKAIRLGMQEATRIGERYIADPPLLQPENARFKIYRIAAAIAARTFSTTDGEILEVYEDHVLSAIEFLDRIYSFEGMGYARRSRRLIDARNAARERKTATVQYLLANPDTVLHTLQSIGGTTFRARDFEEIGGMNKDDSHQVVKKLIAWKVAIRKTRGDLAMDRTLINILREFDDREHEEL